jgi:hypothetical protein
VESEDDRWQVKWQEAVDEVAYGVVVRGYERIWHLYTVVPGLVPLGEDPAVRRMEEPLVDVILDYLSGVSYRSSHDFDLGLIYVSRQQPDHRMLNQTPRIRQMIQSPPTPFDNQQTPHLQDIRNQPFNTRLHTHCKQYIEHCPSSYRPNFSRPASLSRW